MIAVLLIPTARSDVPYPAPPPGEDPYAYHRYAFLSGGASPDENVGERLEYSSQKTQNPLIDGNPQELYGVKGPSVTRAWETTTGRPDVVIAVIDSGIRWQDLLPDLRRKIYLNRGELPLPEGGPNPADRRFGGYDVNGDGVFNIDDYAGDSRVRDLNGNGVLDPEDLILDPTFSNGVDDDGNGYVDDIAGWDFFEDDNDARDEPRFGHGTNEAIGSAAEANNGGEVGTCPNCMIMPLRVGDSFIADVQHWAEATVYAADNGASLVQEALGALNNSRFGQEAADYAWRRGVVIVAAAADEEAAHHNYPATYNHTMMVNAIRNAETPARQPQSYLFLDGCTNFGGHLHVSVPGESCSSEATARAGGMAGLVYSAALNALDQGNLTLYPRGDGTFASFVLSACEVKQVFRAVADDVDFSDPAPPTLDPPFPGAPPNNYAITEVLPSERYHSVRGWDQFTGYGRVNARRMVELVAASTPGHPTIPPEAELNEPLWFETVRTGRLIDLVGRVAANRASSYTYRVQWAAGVQPPEWPAEDVWHELDPVQPGPQNRPYAGVLARLDTDLVQAAILAREGWQPDPLREPTSKSLPERFAFRCRVQVVDDLGNLGEDQKQLFVHDDPRLHPGWPRQLHADGASSPAFADLDDDGRDELVIATSNGEVHAFRADGTELAGWPVSSDPGPAARHGDAPGFRSGEITLPVRGALLVGSPAVADLDRDGELEVVAADLEGKVYVWEKDGARRPGFPVSVDRRFSEVSSEGALRDRFNRRDWAINAAPSIGDLDGNDGGRLEIVSGSSDSHVYAWNDDGTPVPGWPVLLRDPSKVASVDPVTHHVTFRPDANQRIGTKVIVTPSLGDLDGDGQLEVVVGVNEEYAEDPNFSFNNATLAALRLPGVALERFGRDPFIEQGNGRLYALDHRGTLTPQAADRFPAFPDEQAYLPGWPVRVAVLITELLPYIGTGINGAAALADIDGDRDLEIGVFSFAGPGYVFDHRGVSIWGRDPQGHDIALASERAQFGPLSDGVDSPAFPTLGGGIFTRLVPGGRVSFAAPGTGLIRVLDLLLSAHQLGGQDYLLAWDLTIPGGAFLPGFPHEVNDLQITTTPASADIDGDGVQELVEGTAVYDLAAVNFLGVGALGWPKFTGGWSLAVPAVGDPDGDGLLEVAQVTREGWLFLWDTTAPACGAADWPKAQHDLWNTSNLHTDAVRPGRIFDLIVRKVRPPRRHKGEHGPGKRKWVELTFTAPGDNGACGRAARYEVRASFEPITTHAIWEAALPVLGAPAPATAGVTESFSLRSPARGLYYAVRTLDEAGNISALSNVARPRRRGGPGRRRRSQPRIIAWLLHRARLL